MINQKIRNIHSYFFRFTIYENCPEALIGLDTSLQSADNLAGNYKMWKKNFQIVFYHAAKNKINKKYRNLENLRNWNLCEQ